MSEVPRPRYRAGDPFRLAFGSDLDPDALAAAARNPVQSAERLLESWHRLRLPPGDLPPLSPGELRPLIGKRSPLRFDTGLRWAEKELDRLTAALTYSHGAVIYDPMSYIETALRLNELNAESLLSMLHITAFVDPLNASGAVWTVPQVRITSGWKYKGPWPRGTLRPRWDKAVYEMMRSVEDWLGWSHESELRPSVNHINRRSGHDTAIVATQQANALRGKAQLLWDEPEFGTDWDAGYDESRYFENQVAKAQIIALLRAVIAVRLRGASFDPAAGEISKLQLLLRRPVPDMSCVRSADLIAVRESDAFGRIRGDIGGALERYEAAIVSGRTDVGAEIADEFRATSETVEAELARSSALAAMRTGISMVAVTAAAQLALAAVHLNPSPFDVLAVPAVVGGINYARALVATHHKRLQRSQQAAHATVARAVADRFDLL